MSADYHETWPENEQRGDDTTRMRISANNFCDIAPFDSAVGDQLSNVQLYFLEYITY